MRKGIAVLMTVLMVLSLCAPIASVAEEKIVLNYYTWETAEEKNPIFQQFMDENPGIEVKVNIIPDNNDKMTKLDIMALGGGEIDIMPLADGDQFLRGENGILRPLNDFIERDGIDMKANFGSYEFASKVGDTYICYPMRANVTVVFYNKDLFDAAGVAYPPDVWTKDEYIETARKLTSGEGVSKVYGTYNHTWGGEWLNWAVAKGAYYTGDGKCNFDNEYFVDALKTRKVLDDEGVQMSFTEVNAAKTLPNNEFLGGHCAMVLCGSWLVRDMKDKERFPFSFNAGIAYFPLQDSSVAPKTTNGSVSGLGIPNTSKHPEEAWKFIRYYVEKGSQNIAAAGNMPVYLPSYSDDTVKIFAEGSGLSLEDASKLFDPENIVIGKMPIGPAMSEYWQIVNEETQMYFTGAQSLEDTVSNVMTRAGDAIEKAKAA